MKTDVADALRNRLDRLYVINLESRPDRRAEMLAELDHIGLQADSALVHFFPAVKPDHADTFPSIGARGCFLSHLGVLKDAQARGCAQILILEDDAALVPSWRTVLPSVLQELEGLDWSLAYLGHRIEAADFPGPDAARSEHWRELPVQTGIQTTHAMVIHQRAIAPLIAYLERMMARAPGHAEGGPMHVDGAYSWFRRDHPEMRTLVTAEQHIVQRASKSDIAPPSWKEKIPFLSTLRALKNQLSGRG